MITLKTLSWSNCFSYGPNNFIDFEKDTLTQLIGLNGYGKSSIPLILEECLYNKNSKGKKKASIPNRHIKDGYSIELVFSSDADTYRVSVSRKSTIKVKLEKNGEDISSHTATNTYKTIESVLGIDFKTFSQLVYQNTNASLQFLTATDTNRKKFLIDLLHLERYVRLFEIFKEAARVSNSRLTEASTKATTIRDWLDSNILEDTEILPTIKIDISTEEDEKCLASLSVELQNIEQKNKKIQDNLNNKRLLNAIDIKEVEKVKATELLSYDSLQREEGDLKGTIRASKAEIQKIKDLGDKCPSCKQDIDLVEKNRLLKEKQLIIAEAEEKLTNEIEAEIRAIKANNLEYNYKVKTQRDWESLWNSIDNSLPARTIDRTELENDIREVRTRIGKAKAKIAATIAENDKRTKKNTRIQVIAEQTTKFEAQLKEAQDILDEEAALNSNLEILKKAFSTNGLLAYKIENLVKELEDLTNSYLSEFSDGRFTLEFVVVSDKLNVVITDLGDTVGIEDLSTGELAKVNTAALLAIRKLMASISKSKLNILFLDEVTSTLDDFAKEKLVEILLEEKELNVFIVSHGWAHPLVSKINIVKEQKISRLEY